MKNKKIFFIITILIILILLIALLKYNEIKKNQTEINNKTKINFTNTENGIEVRDSVTNTLIKNITDEGLIKMYQDNPDYNPNYLENENLISK